MRLSSTMRKLRHLASQPEVRNAITLTAAGAAGCSLLLPDEPIYLRRTPSDNLEADKKREELNAGVKGVKQRAFVKPAHEIAGREIAATRFKRGDWWEWEYKDGQNRTTSWEVGTAAPRPGTPHASHNTALS